MNTFLGWIALGIGFSFAIALPLTLLGVDKNYIWPIALFCSALLIIIKPGGTVEKCLSLIFSNGIIFSGWCFIGILLVIALNLIGLNIRPPESLILIAAVGVYGLHRSGKTDESSAKSQKQ